MIETQNFEGGVDAVIGTGRGDEAKARWVVERLESGLYTAAVRYNGADNAGHTSTVLTPEGEREINMHQVPMGVLFPGVRNLIARTSYVNPVSLLDEIDYLNSIGVEVDEENLGISDTTHLILPGHVILDNLREDSDEKQGATGKGISFVAADKGERIGVRVEDLFIDTDRIEEAVIRSIEKANLVLKANGKPEKDVMEVWRNWFKKSRGLARYVVDTTVEIRDIIHSGDKVIAEGAQAFGLGLDTGSYPYVTSSDPGITGVMLGLGVGPKDIGNVYGAAKSIPSSVGAPRNAFPTVMEEEMAETIRGDVGVIDSERGKSTGRPRDLGWIDIPALRSAVKEGGITEICMAKLDWVPRVGPTTLIAESYGESYEEYAPTSSVSKLKGIKPNYIELPTWSEPISHVRDFENLPREAQRWVQVVQDLLPVPITKIGVGPNRDEYITLQH